jgi:hypothetical protein
MEVIFWKVKLPENRGNRGRALQEIGSVSLEKVNTWTSQIGSGLAVWLGERDQNVDRLTTGVMMFGLPVKR